MNNPSAVLFGMLTVKLHFPSYTDTFWLYIWFTWQQNSCLTPIFQRLWQQKHIFSFYMNCIKCLKQSCLQPEVIFYFKEIIPLFTLWMAGMSVETKEDKLSFGGFLKVFVISEVG